MIHLSFIILSNYLQINKKIAFFLKKGTIPVMKVAVNIRMPERMKKALDEIAESEFRSLNSLILQFLDEQLKSKDINWRERTPED